MADTDYSAEEKEWFDGNMFKVAPNKQPFETISFSNSHVWSEEDIAKMKIEKASEKKFFAQPDEQICF